MNFRYRGIHFLVVMFKFIQADIVSDICRNDYFTDQCRDKRPECSFNKAVNELCWEDRVWECPESSKLNWVLYNCCGACCAISKIRDFWKENEILVKKGDKANKNQKVVVNNSDAGKQDKVNEGFLLNSGKNNEIEKVADQIIKITNKKNMVKNNPKEDVFITKNLSTQKINKNEVEKSRNFMDLETQFQSLTKKIDDLRYKLNAYLAIRKLILREKSAPMSLKAIERFESVINHFFLKD